MSHERVGDVTVNHDPLCARGRGDIKVREMRQTRERRLGNLLEPPNVSGNLRSPGQTDASSSESVPQSRAVGPAAMLSQALTFSDEFSPRGVGVRRICDDGAFEEPEKNRLVRSVGIKLHHAGHAE